MDGVDIYNRVRDDGTLGPPPASIVKKMLDSSRGEYLEERRKVDMEELRPLLEDLFKISEFLEDKGYEAERRGRKDDWLLRASHDIRHFIFRVGGISRAKLGDMANERQLRMVLQRIWVRPNEPDLWLPDIESVMKGIPKKGKRRLAR